MLSNFCDNSSHTRFWAFVPSSLRTNRAGLSYGQQQDLAASVRKGQLTSLLDYNSCIVRGSPGLIPLH